MVFEMEDPRKVTREYLNVKNGKVRMSQTSEEEKGNLWDLCKH